MHNARINDKTMSMDGCSLESFFYIYGSCVISDILASLVRGISGMNLDNQSRFYLQYQHIGLRSLVAIRFPVPSLGFFVNMHPRLRIFLSPWHLPESAFHPIFSRYGDSVVQSHNLMQDESTGISADGWYGQAQLLCEDVLAVHQHDIENAQDGA